MKPPRTTVRRLLPRFLPHKRALLLALALAAVQAAVPGGIVFLVKSVLDDVLVARDPAAIPLVSGAVLALYLLNGVVGFGRAMLARRVAWEVMTALRVEVFAALLAQEPAWHRRQQAGALTSRVLTDVDAIQYGVAAIVGAVHKPLTLLVLLGSAWHMSPELTAVAAVVVPAVVLPIRALGHHLRRRSQQGLSVRAHLAAFTTETLATIEALQASRAEAPRTAHFSRRARSLQDAALTAFAARMAPSPVVESLAAVGVALVIWVGGQQVVGGTLEPGELIAFVVAVSLLNGPLKGLAEVNSLFQRAVAGADAAFSVIDRAPALSEGSRPLERRAGAPGISLQHVTIDHGDGPILTDISLTVALGETVALAGASGVGKTSLARLVPRLADPASGTVEVLGEPVTEVTLSSLRAHVAWVGQHPLLLDDTVAANIALARPDASPAQIQRAAEAAAAHTFISALPDGYHTRLGEGGHRLSGGERQRICIARALLQDAPVLVLDEPTSALDEAVQEALTTALDRLRAGRAVLLIAHRPSTLAVADRVIELPGDRP